MISSNCYKQQEGYYSPYNSDIMLETKQAVHSMESPNPNYCSGYPLTHVNDHGQYPSHKEFEGIIQDYLQNLSSKKRDKALIDQKRYQMVLQVLKDPRNTSLSTAQFRFWVKKMFQLTAKHVVCHDGKPVATREQIYSILVRAHREVHHGGRDKTSTLVRQRYSWIPKELIARFVRHCPFCISRRNGNQPSTFIDPSHSPIYPNLPDSTAMAPSSSCESFSSEYQDMNDYELLSINNNTSWPYYSEMYQQNSSPKKTTEMEGLLSLNKNDYYAHTAEQNLPYMNFTNQPLQFPYLHQDGLKSNPDYPLMNDYSFTKWSAPSPSMSHSSASSSSISSPNIKYPDSFVSSASFNLLCHQTFF